jgi:hypothetical protein
LPHKPPTHTTNNKQQHLLLLHAPANQFVCRNDQDTKRYTTLQTRTHTHVRASAPPTPQPKRPRRPRRVHCSRPLSNNQEPRSPTSPDTATKTAGV